MGMHFPKPVTFLPNQMIVRILIHEPCEFLVFLSHSCELLSIKGKLKEVGRIAIVPLQHGYLSRLNLEAPLKHTVSQGRSLFSSCVVTNPSMNLSSNLRAIAHKLTCVL